MARKILITGAEGQLGIALQRTLSDKFDVFPSSKFIKEGFFGSTITNPDLNSVLGDLTVLSRKGVALMHRFRTDQKASLKGYHGGLVDDELFVPLFTIKPKNIS